MSDMELIVLFAVAFFPVHLALRAPFLHMPLHMDTGFYVSNHTVRRRKLRFSRGWNAHFAGCSKVPTETFYALVYLLHGGARYAVASRLWYSLYAYLAAVAVGASAWLLDDRSFATFALGLACFSVFSSEPQYGVYYESGEQFQVLPQTFGFALIAQGLITGEASVVGAGVACWALDAFFTKLSSIPATLVLAAGAALLLPGSIPWSAGALGAAGIAYGLWTVWNGKSLRSLLGPLAGHERFYSHRPGVRHYLGNGARKLRLLVRQAALEPIAPALALGGLAVLDPALRVPFGLWIAGLAVVLLIQGAQVWYYSIPFLPVYALLAALGLRRLLEVGHGTWLLAALSGAWLAIFLGRYVLASPGARHRRVWSVHGPDFPARAARLERVAARWRGKLGGRSLFLHGWVTQAYVLFEASYETPYVAAAPWLDAMDAGWFARLLELFRSDPPDAILAEDPSSFDPEVYRRELGVDLELVDSLEPGVRLYFRRIPQP